MPTEQEKTLEALRTAIEMEIDGKECYLEASKGSTNQVGKTLLRSLAAEEDTHRRKFEEIYKAISGKKAWPVTDFRPDGGKKLRTVFARTCEAIGIGEKSPPGEMDVVKTALDKENKSFDLYRRLAKAATYDSERDFYEILAGEEHEHSLVLLDYYEYMKDPGAWFVKAEHPSLDGG